MLTGWSPSFLSLCCVQPVIQMPTATTVQTLLSFSPSWALCITFDGDRYKDWWWTQLFESLNLIAVFRGMADISFINLNRAVFLKSISASVWYCVCSISGRKSAFVCNVRPAVSPKAVTSICSTLRRSRRGRAEQMLCQSISGHMALGSH